MDDLRIDDRLTLPAAALSWSAARAEGPGGQHVNKTSTKVELRCDLQLAGVDPAVIRRLHSRRASWFVGDHALLVVSQKTRSQGRNLQDALDRLASALAAAAVPPTPRRPTRPTRASKERRLEGKRRDAAIKRDRGPVRGD